MKVKTTRKIHKRKPSASNYTLVVVPDDISVPLYQGNKEHGKTLGKAI